MINSETSSSKSEGDSFKILKKSRAAKWRQTLVATYRQ